LWHRAKQIEDDLAADIKKAQRCYVDDFIKYFLYLVLKDGEKKRQIDKIQSDIEKLQHERHYPNAETSTTVIDQDKVSEQEKNLVKRRAKILDGLLKKSVEAVLPIANDETVKSLLRK
jgi:hypothetical protein